MEKDFSGELAEAGWGDTDQIKTYIDTFTDHDTFRWFRDQAYQELHSRVKRSVSRPPKHDNLLSWILGPPYLGLS